MWGAFRALVLRELSEALPLPSMLGEGASFTAGDAAVVQLISEQTAVGASREPTSADGDEGDVRRMAEVLALVRDEGSSVTAVYGL